MLWWLGAVALLIMAIPCGLTLGRRVAAGEARPWQPGVAAWLVGWHGAVGVAALWMVSQAAG